MKQSQSCQSIHIKNSKHYNPASKFRLLPLLKKSDHLISSQAHEAKFKNHNQEDLLLENNSKSSAFHLKINNQITSRYILINESVQADQTQNPDQHKSNQSKSQQIYTDKNADPFAKISKLGQKYVELNEKYLNLLQNKLSSRVQSLYLSRCHDKFLRDSRCREALSQLHSSTAQKPINYSLKSSKNSKSSRVELEQLKSKLNQVNFSKLKQLTSDEKSKGNEFSQQKFIKIKNKVVNKKQNQPIIDQNSKKNRDQKQVSTCFSSYQKQKSYKIGLSLR